MERLTILIADDEASLRKLLSLILKDNGYRVLLAKDGLDAYEIFKKEHIDLVLMDIRMPNMDGLQVLREIKKDQPNVPIILMTAYAGVDTAVEALKQGAFDYIIKPFDLENITLLIDKALNNQIDKYPTQIDVDHEKSEQILSNSPSMMKLCRNIAKVSQTNASVLISGDSGTGKELVAKAIHYHSKRSDGPFIKVNCGALAESLLESALFGHEKGAFTGAQNKQLGLFERANKGTLLLDEVGEMSPGLQVKLLRVLQEREFEPIGSSKTVKADFRLIAATNSDLYKMVNEDKFRMDLFYRLNVIHLELPPLRERTEDIILLAEYFVQKFCNENHQEPLKLSDDAINILNEYQWPGNVRELSNAIEHAVVMSTGGFICENDLPQYILLNYRNPMLSVLSMEECGDQTLKETMKNYEREVILNVLRINGGHRGQTAKALGVSIRTLIYKIHEYGIEI